MPAAGGSQDGGWQSGSQGLFEREHKGSDMSARMKGPTPAQSAVLAFIEAFIGGHGYPPTLAEIAKNFGWKSPHAAQEHVRRLVAKGLLTRDKGTARGLRLQQHAHEQPI